VRSSGHLRRNTEQIAPVVQTEQTEPNMVAAMWRGPEIFRPIAWLYAVYSVFVRQQDLARPWLAWLVLGVLGAWTAIMLRYRARGRTTTLLGIELALACLAILSTGLVDTPEVIAAGARTLPGLWPAAAVAGWAVLRGWRAGMIAALLVGIADLVEIGVATRGVAGAGTLNNSTVNNIVILVLLGGCIGYCADLARNGHAALSEALRVQAEVRERDRLARTVHDGVLQTLSFIHRRGVDLGGPARELAVMAAEQERLLRALVSRVPSTPAPDRQEPTAGKGAQLDLRSVLGRYAGRSVNIIPPAGPVLMAARIAEELDAAVGTALDNVRRHAGDDAQAWVLIEDKGSEVTVTIRDDGVGVPAGRLAEAAASGRMGVANSILGRIGDLGGTATLESSPATGTCVELTVAKNGVS
jgi:signal transduction histidine kinase